MSSQIGEDCTEAHLLHMKIASQLEQYLSNCYLAEDGFLLKHVQRNKLGYVSLKLLTSFKKMKVLTRDWRISLAGARCSKLLEVNEEGTKVRRREPLPKWLLRSPTSKLLFVWNLFGEQTGEDKAAQGLEHPRDLEHPRSLEHPRDLERISKLFSIHGSVTSVRILHPGKELPTKLQYYAKRHSELGHHLCALVEFEHLEGARRAHSALRAEEHKCNGKGMCVVSLGFPGTWHINKEEPPEEMNGHPPEEAKPSQKSSKHEFKGLIRSSEDSVLEKSSSLNKGSFRAPHRLLGSTLDKISTGCHGQPFSEFRNRYTGRNGCSGDGQDSSRSPWVQRRKVAASAAHPEGAGQLNKTSMLQKVLRQPYGPDDTRGFHNSRGRGKLLRQE